MKAAMPFSASGGAIESARVSARERDKPLALSESKPRADFERIARAHERRKSEGEEDLSAGQRRARRKTDAASTCNRATIMSI